MTKPSEIELLKKEIEVLKNQVSVLKSENTHLISKNGLLLPGLHTGQTDNTIFEIPEFIELIPEPVIICDSITSRILHVNSAACKMSGYTVAEFGQLFFKDLFTNLTESPSDSRLPRKIQQYRFLKNNGTFDHLSLSRTTLSQQDRNFDLIILRSINEYLNIIEEILNSEELYKNIIQTQNELIVRILYNGIIIFANSAFQKYFELSHERVTGSNFLNFLDPEYQSVFISKTSHLSKQNPSCSLDVKHHTGNNTVKYLEWTCIAIFDESGNIVTYQVTGRDITRLKEYENDLVDSKIKAEESDRLKSIFLANMSHEIRTPMNSIIGFSTLLEDLSYSLEQKTDFIHAISMSANNLLEIIQNITDLSLLESRQANLVKSEFSLERFFKDFNSNISEIKFLNNRENLPVNYRQNEEDVNLFADKKRLHQILINIVGNAIKFTHQGFVEYGYLIQDREVMFFVKDTGIGIPTHLQSMIFEKFRQVDEGNTRKYGGLGLGLTIAKALTELMDGKIWFESYPNSGSTFYISMPIPPQITDQRVLSYVESGSNINYWANKTILAAEDESINYILLKKILKFSAANLIWAKDGQEAVDIVSSGRSIHLVLMDLKMPVKDGFQATIEIKALRPSLPVLALTAYSLPQDQKRALESGCSDFITKPINIDSLLKKVSNYIL